MARPILNDTIVALASGRRPSAVGIVRLSGPAAVEISSQVILDSQQLDRERSSGHPRNCAVRLSFADASGFAHRVPARVLEFQSPRSYTGQELVEIHTVGSLPLLDALVDALIRHGARAATAGEFTARAFLNGKLDRAGVEDTLSLIQAQSAAEASQGARHERSTHRIKMLELRERILDLLARVEAGIDFVDEEGISFVSGEEVAGKIDAFVTVIDGLGSRRGGVLPHVVLLGLPNAGKSTLFNALVGSERSIVSMHAGTTRDVVSCEIEFGGVAVVLQDSAGQAHGMSALDHEAMRVALNAAQNADIVVFLHDSSQKWTVEESGLFERLPPDRRLLVLTKSDLPVAFGLELPGNPAYSQHVCANQEATLTELRKVIGRMLSRANAVHRHELAEARRYLERCCQLVKKENSKFFQAELVAEELRAAAEALFSETGSETDEQILNRIFSEFCIGK